MSALIHVGIDAGGTKTAVMARAGDQTVVETGPGAQASRDESDAIADSLADLIRRACSSLHGDLSGLAVGLAGAGRPEIQTAVRDALRRRVGDIPIQVLHDGAIAHRAAWGDGSGVVLLVGTGSSLVARDHEGRLMQAGGWGPALGDDGSGASLGRAALRALLASLEGGPPSALPELAAEWGLTSARDVLQAVYHDRRALADFAPLALAAAEAGDWTAEGVLRAETNALAKQAGWLATASEGTVVPRLRYLGGLTTEPVYRAALDDALSRYLPGWTVEPCETPPVEGALDLAMHPGEAPSHPEAI